MFGKKAKSSSQHGKMFRVWYVFTIIPNIKIKLFKAAYLVFCFIKPDVERLHLVKSLFRGENRH